MALLASLSICLLAIRAPLWLDETLSYWQVSGGFGKIWSRSAQMPSSIGYLYTLWAAKSVLGTSELVLKLPSLLALLAAVYFLFRAVSELFNRETAFLACVFFSLEGNVIFAATDARPYAFALLMTTIAIFAFIRWMDDGQMHQAIGFGAAAAGILYFHYLFGSILPVFAIYYLSARWGSIKGDVKQLAAIVGSFTVLSLPLIYRVLSLYHTRVSHTIEQSSHPVLAVLNILAPKQTLIGFLILLFLAAVVRKVRLPEQSEFPRVLLPILLALVPAGILFGVSATTSLRLLVSRYLTVIAPGSAMTWALLTSQINSPRLRQVFCLGLVAVTVYESYSSPFMRRHELSFRQAHEIVNDYLAKEDVPVLVGSAFIESNYGSMPDSSSEDAIWSQTEYYPIHGHMILLPMSLNDETVKITSKATLDATTQRHSFLVVAAPPSYPTVEWLANYTRGSFTARVLGKFDEILVVEFRPVTSLPQ